MKNVLQRMLALGCMIGSIIVLCIAIIYPLVLSGVNHPPYWTCWILYPVTLLVMASQSEMIKWFDKVMND